MNAGSTCLWGLTSSSSPSWLVIFTDCRRQWNIWIWCPVNHLMQFGWCFQNSHYVKMEEYIVEWVFCSLYHCRRRQGVLFCQFTCHCICAHKHTFCFSTRGIFKNKHVCDDYPHLVLIVADPIRNQVLHEYHTRLWILYKIIVSCIFAWTTNKKFWTHQF